VKSTAIKRFLLTFDLDNHRQTRD